MDWKACRYIEWEWVWAGLDCLHMAESGTQLLPEARSLCVRVTGGDGERRGVTGTATVLSDGRWRGVRVVQSKEPETFIPPFNVEGNLVHFRQHILWLVTCYVKTNFIMRISEEFYFVKTKLETFNGHKIGVFKISNEFFGLWTTWWMRNFNNNNNSVHILNAHVWEFKI